MPFLNAERLFVSNTNVDYTELLRVQTVSISQSHKRAMSGHIGGNKTYNTNVQQLQSAAITFQYIGYEAYNEGLIGFSGDFAGKLISGRDIRNYNVQISGAGMVNITGAALTNYSINASINDYPKHSVTFDVFEMGYWTGVTAQDPNPFATGCSTPAILPGNIDAQFSGACGVLEMSIQDFNLSIDIDRDYSTYAGYKTPAIKRVTFPMEATLSMTAYLESFQTGMLHSYFDITTGIDLRVIYKNKQGDNTNGGFKLSNAYLVNQEISNEAMERTRVSLQFSCFLGIVDTKTSPKGSLYVGM